MDTMSDLFRQALLPLVKQYVEDKEAQRIRQAIERRVAVTVMPVANDQRPQ